MEGPSGNLIYSLLVGPAVPGVSRQAKGSEGDKDKS